MNRIAVVSIIVEKSESVEKLNASLHTYGEYIIGRMGLPYRKNDSKFNIISIAMDAEEKIINSLVEEVGKLDGISANAVYANV